MDYGVRILADSIGPHEVRLTTFELRYPRAAVHEDFLTHRDFSRNGSSSRAMPVEAMIARADWRPEEWGRNRKGMGAEDVLTGDVVFQADNAWASARWHAVANARELMRLGVAKEDANLLLRPFEWIDVVVSSTRWRNWFFQRADEATGKARRQIKRVADGMRDLLISESPVFLEPGRWHLPYVTAEELAGVCAGTVDRREAAYASAMRCARVSYAKHDGTHATIAEDAAACKAKMRDNHHWSPMEHPAECLDPDTGGEPIYDWGNYDAGWLQLRKRHPEEYVR